MAKTNDLKDLGEVYGNLGKEATVVAENLEAQTVGDSNAAIGDAELQHGGPTKESGFEESEVDIKKVGDKNPYNIKGLSYGDENCPTTETEQPEEVEDEDGEGEEDEEEFSAEALEIAQEGLNKYMANKSIFDKLYTKVINEDFGMEEVDDLDALGIDDATPDDEIADDEGGEVTITLDKDLAQALHDVLMAAMGEDDDVEDDDVEDDDMGDDELPEDNEGQQLSDEFYEMLDDVLMEYGTEDHRPVIAGMEAKLGRKLTDHETESVLEMIQDDELPDYEEDNEGEPSAFNTHYNDGKSNKVGNVGDGFGQPKVQSMNKVHHKPTAGPSSKEGVPKSHSGSYNDGKSNKVGNVPKDGFGKPKVQPRNKSVKA